MSEGAVRLGWWLSSEEHDPRALVAAAQLAESSGFETAMISDHLQPWVTAQGHAGHVWTTIGAIAQATDRLEVGTGVVAMVHRSHPLTVAHAAATAAVLLEDRFFLGVGAGERLNEQPFGKRWPSSGERRRWLADAIDVIRQVWSGGPVSIDEGHWRVEGFRLFERPASPPPIYVAAGGRGTAELAGERGDGLVGVRADPTLVDAYRSSGGDGPKIGQLHVALAPSVDAASDLAWEWWPNGAVAPLLLGELARPAQFEAAAANVGREAIDGTVVCASGPEPVIRAIDRFVAAGYGTVYLHQVGPDQRRLADMATSDLLPHYTR